VYIVYRYVENIASGNGFVYNVGEYVEGVSCFLWTVLLVPFSYFSFDLVAATPWISALLALLIVFFLPKVITVVAPDTNNNIRVIACFFLASYPCFAFWAKSGLETSLYGLLLLTTIYTFFLDSKKMLIVSALAGIATCLTRPEGPFILAAIPLGHVMHHRGKELNKLILWCGIVAAGFLLFLSFRYSYFGDLFPNTYYAKVGGDVYRRITKGFLYSFNFLSTLTPLVLFDAKFSGIVASLIVTASWFYGFFNRRLRYLSLAVLLNLVFIFVAGGDWMPLFRFWVPLLPFILILVASAFYRLKLNPSAPITASFCLLFAVSHFLYVSNEKLSPFGMLNIGNAAQLSALNETMANYINENTDSTDKIAVLDIGEIGYKTNLYVIDLAGLVTPWIAKAEGTVHNKSFPVEKLLAQKPKFIILRQNFDITNTLTTNEEVDDAYKVEKVGKFVGGLIYVLKRKQDEPPVLK